MSAKRPVKDWATDFDHTDPRWVSDPYPIWDVLRERCPVAHSGRFEDGAYFPSRYADVREISYDTEHFSSRRVIVREKKINPLIPSPPITSDPPENRPARMPLLPAFNAKAIERLTPSTRELCGRLIDRFIAQGRCDAATDYAQHIPTRVIAHMLGVDENDGDRFRTWIKMALEEGIHDASRTMQAIGEMSAYFKAELARRGDAQGEDLISFMRDLRQDRKPIPEDRLVGTLRLLLIAGIDTTWSAIGASLWHLATHDEDRRRLVAEPALMDTAVEELLRAYAPVTMARCTMASTWRSASRAQRSASGPARGTSAASAPRARYSRRSSRSGGTMTEFRSRVPLGQTGLSVSRLGIGSSFTGSPRFIEEAVEQGVNYLYWGSIRRPAFGRALRNVAKHGRERVVLTVQSYSRVAALMAPSVEIALRRAGVEYFDFLLLGMWNRPPWQALVDAALRLRAQGKVRHLMLSTHNRPSLQGHFREFAAGCSVVSSLYRSSLSS